MNWLLRRFEEIDSTQTWLLEQAEHLPEGTCVVAGRQFAGVGRQQRSWQSESGGLYVSFLLKPERLLPELPWALAWALLDGLEAQTGLEIELKAPNDLILNNRKLAGMLIDSRLVDMRPLYYVCGFGVNLNQTSFSQNPGISLLQITGQHWQPEQVLQGLLKRFAEIYALLLKGDFAAGILAALSGRQVRIGYNVPDTILFEEYWHGGGT